MKNYYLRTCVALACVFGLVACGGGHEDLVLRITSITGLTKAGLTVSNNGGTPEPVDFTLGYYTFLNKIGSDSNFEIKVVTDPPNAKCTVYNGKGKTSTYSPTNIVMQCIPNPHDVTAAVIGLGATNTGLVVVNGSEQFAIAAATTSYKFTKYAADGTTVVSGQVGDGVAYGYVVLTQPVGKTCTIPNGGGIMGDHDITIDIVCV